MSSTDTASALESSANRLPLFAALAMLAWVAGEFAFRRGLVPHLADVVGNARGADMLAIAVGFPVLAAGIAWAGTRVGVHRGDWGYDVTLRAVAAGVGGFVAYVVAFFGAAIVYTTVLGIQPSVATGALGVDAAPAWALVALLVVNGVLVPITEEWAWRGVVQTALTERYGDAIAIVATAVPFVLKHVVVDMGAPLFRVTSLVVMAFVLCGLRARWGTASSTVAHLAANGVFTALAVVPMLA